MNSKSAAQARDIGLLQKVFVGLTAADIKPSYRKTAKNGSQSKPSRGQSAAPREFGTVKWYDAEKGYGFITPVTGTDAVFVHATDVERAQVRKLAQGQRIEFERVEARGKTSAKNLKIH